MFCEALDSYSSRVRVEGWDRAYVSYFQGDSYIPLLEVVIDAVHVFSRYPILLYVSGDKPNVPDAWLTRFPRLVVYSMPRNVLHPWFDKLRVILLANVRRGVILEADTIIAPSADRLFNLFDNFRSGTVELLAPQHPDLRLSPGIPCLLPNCTQCCVNGYPFPVSERVGRGLYRHAHLIWGASGRRFIKDVLKRCVSNETVDFDCSSDEAAVNMAIWQSSERFEELCLQDPDRAFWRRVYSETDARTLRNAVQQEFGPRTIVFNFCHGAKDAEEARSLLAMLKRVFLGRNVSWILEDGVLLQKPSSSVGLLGHDCLVA